MLTDRKLQNEDKDVGNNSSCPSVEQKQANTNKKVNCIWFSAVIIKITGDCLSASKA